MWETQVWSLGWEDPLEKGMATHSSIRLENSMDRGAWQAASPWGLKDSDTTEWLMLSLSFQSVSMQTSKNNKVGTSLAVQWLRIHASTLGLTPVVVQSPSCIRLCAVHGVTEGWTRLKWLSTSTRVKKVILHQGAEGVGGKD